MVTFYSIIKSHVLTEKSLSRERSNPAFGPRGLRVLRARGFRVSRVRVHFARSFISHQNKIIITRSALFFLFLFF